MKRLRRLALAAAIAVAALGTLAGAWRLYEAAAMVRPDATAGSSYGALGPYPVGARNGVVRGDGGLPVTVWYPASDDGRGEVRSSYAYSLKWFVRLDRVARVAGRARWNAPFDPSLGPRPLVLLSPGFTVGRSGYAWLAERLASHGLVVVAPEHAEVMTESLDAFWRAAVTRPRDARAVLDWATAEASTGLLQGVVDVDRIAVIGHSLGGYTALAVAGARIDVEAVRTTCEQAHASEHANAWLCDLLLDHASDMAAVAGLGAPPAGLWPSWRDRRVDAVVTMAGDAFPFGPAGLASVSVPVLAMGGTSDTGTPYAWGTEPTYAHVASARAVRATFDGAEHMIFAAGCGAAPFLRLVGRGMLCGDATWDVDRAHDAIAQLTVAFLLAELTGDRAAAASLAPGSVHIGGVGYVARGY